MNCIGLAMAAGRAHFGDAPKPRPTKERAKTWVASPGFPGLYSSRVRTTYHPTMAAWTSRDIPYIDGPNLYGYCGGDPTNGTDPMGLREILGNGIEVLPTGRIIYDPATDSTSGQGQEAAQERRARAAKYAANAPVVGAGVGSVVLINGKTAFRLGDTDFYVTGSAEPGFTGKQTSALVIYKASNPKKGYRLDFGEITKGPNAGYTGWHHNQKGMKEIVKVTNHEIAGNVASTAGRAITIFKWGGRFMFVAGVVGSSLEVYYADDKARALAREAAGWAAAYGTAKAGATLLARAGSRFGPWGSAIGAALGSVGGGIVGYAAGYNAADAIWELAATKLEEEEWLVCDESGME